MKKDEVRADELARKLGFDSTDEMGGEAMQALVYCLMNIVGWVHGRVAAALGMTCTDVLKINRNVEDRLCLGDRLMQLYMRRLRDEETR